MAVKVFVGVADLGSLTAVAEQMGLSRAMATRHIAFLERTFGVRLLHRTSRTLGPTRMGHDLLPRCRAMLALNEEMEAFAIGVNAEPRGVIRVGCSVSFGQSYLAGALLRYAERFPKVAVEMVLSDRALQIEKERIDLALHVGDDLDPGLIARPLGKCSSVVCAAPAYLTRHGVPVRPGDLAQHNCMVHTRHGTVWHFTGRRKKMAEEVTVNGHFAANDMVVLLQAALAGHGIVHLPSFCVEAHLRSGTLVRVLPGHTLPTLGIHALFASRKQLPVATRALLDFLLEDIAH